MKSFRERLNEISPVFFSEDGDYGKIYATGKQYKALLMEVSKLQLGTNAIDETIFTESGKAIGPTYASMCVDDIFRTYKYILGLYKAVKHVQDSTSKKVNILYAGTGPFATLALPLTSIFSSEEITFTLVEINEDSFNALQNTFANLELEAYVSEFILDDATTLQIKAPDTIDIVVIETMTAALKSEQQVAISYNLVPQLSSNSILIPTSIQLDLLAIDEDKKHQNKISFDQKIDYYENLGILFTLDKTAIAAHSEAFKNGFPKFVFPVHETEIPEHVNEEFSNLSVATAIKIYDDITLGIDESGLTMLLTLYPIDPMKELGTALATKYVCGKNPRLQCKLLE